MSLQCHGLLRVFALHIISLRDLAILCINAGLLTSVYVTIIIPVGLWRNWRGNIRNAAITTVPNWGNDLINSPPAFSYGTIVSIIVFAIRQKKYWLVPLLIAFALVALFAAMAPTLATGIFLYPMF